MKISYFGERNLIKKVANATKIFSSGVIKGIGDDAAVVKFNNKYDLLLTTDTLVEDDHFNLAWFTPEQIGIKAIESNVSDIAAMGGFPKYALISIIIPKNLSVNFIHRLYKGINKSSKKYKINIVGGNSTHGNKITVTISLIGFVDKKNLCLRSDAKTSDSILVTGNLGSSRAGLQLLRHNKSRENQSSITSIQDHDFNWQSLLQKMESTPWKIYLTV